MLTIKSHEHLHTPTCFAQKHTTMSYWNGPHGVLVPDNVDAVVAADGTNTLYKDGRETEMCACDPDYHISADQYRATFAIQKHDRKHYYIGYKFWTGPYGVLVPDYFDSVVAEDCCNVLFKDGTETKMVADPNEMLSKDEYLATYTLEKQGKHYYVGSLYWLGPHRVLVPNRWAYVPVGDGVNSAYKDGSRTEEPTDPTKLLSEAEYLDRYATVKPNGVRHYIGPKIIGPAIV